jgi:hypothetical protein
VDTAVAVDTGHPPRKELPSSAPDAASRLQSPSSREATALSSARAATRRSPVVVAATANRVVEDDTKQKSNYVYEQKEPLIAALFVF